MFSTKTRDGKAFPAEQKITELKQILFKSKRIEKRSGNKLNLTKLKKKTKRGNRRNLSE